MCFPISEYKRCTQLAVLRHSFVPAGLFSIPKDLHQCGCTIALDSKPFLQDKRPWGGAGGNGAGLEASHVLFQSSDGTGLAEKWSSKHVSQPPGEKGQALGAERGTAVAVTVRSGAEGRAVPPLVNSCAEASRRFTHRLEPRFSALFSPRKGALPLR